LFAFAPLRIQLQFFVILLIVYQDYIIVMEPEADVSLRVWSVIFQFVVAIAVLGIEVGENAFHEEKPRFRVA
jgi:hypothetical protein